MEEMKENGKKLGTKTMAAIIGGGIALAVIIVIVLVCALGNKEEAYRNIRISEVTGTVLVNRGDKENLAAYANMNLLSGDELVTEEGARAVLCLDEDKYVILDGNSKLTLHASGTEEDSKTTLKLEYGAVFSDIKNKLSGSSGYEVVTPASTMSVRGTQFEVVFRGGQVKVLTYEGAVYVAPEGSDEGRTVSAGCWTAIIEASDGTCGFDGEIKTITADDVGSFISSYLEKEGIKFEDSEEVPEPTMVPESKSTGTPDEIEEPAKEPVATNTPKAEPTNEPVVTEPPVPTKEVKATPEPMKEPKATPEPKPTKEPKATPEPKPPVEKPKPGPGPVVKPGEHAIYYYIPLPPKNLLPSDKSYTVTYSVGVLTLATAESADSYAANVGPDAADKATLETDAAPLISKVTEKQLPEVLGKYLNGYGAGTTAKCFGWYDASKKMWFNWTQFLRDATLKEGVLGLYPAYTVQAPSYSVSCVPVIITVEETKEVFRLSVPEGSALKVGKGLTWKDNGAGMDTVTVQYSTISQFTLSKGK